MAAARREGKFHDSPVDGHRHRTAFSADGLPRRRLAGPGARDARCHRRPRRPRPVADRLLHDNHTPKNAVRQSISRRRSLYRSPSHQRRRVGIPVDDTAGQPLPDRQRGQAGRRNDARAARQGRAAAGPYDRCRCALHDRPDHASTAGIRSGCQPGLLPSPARGVGDRGRGCRRLLRLSQQRRDRRLSSGRRRCPVGPTHSAVGPATAHPCEQPGHHRHCEHHLTGHRDPGRHPVRRPGPVGRAASKSLSRVHPGAADRNQLRRRQDGPVQHRCGGWLPDQLDRPGRRTCAGLCLRQRVADRGHPLPGVLGNGPGQLPPRFGGAGLRQRDHRALVGERPVPRCRCRASGRCRHRTRYRTAAPR